MVSIFKKFQSLMRGESSVIDGKSSNNIVNVEKVVTTTENTLAFQEEKDLKLAVLEKKNEKKKEIEEHLYLDLNRNYQKFGTYISNCFYNISIYKSTISTSKAGDISDQDIYNCFYELYSKNHELDNTKAFIQYASDMMGDYVIKYMKGNKWFTYKSDNDMTENGFKESLESYQSYLGSNPLNDSLIGTRFGEHKEELMAELDKDINAMHAGIYGANMYGAYVENKKFDIYRSLVSLIHFLNLASEFDSIDESSEFMTIIDNFIKSGNSDYKYLYEIYNKFYIESFSYHLVLTDFFHIIGYRMMKNLISKFNGYDIPMKRSYEDSTVKLDYQDSYKLFRNNIIHNPNIEKVDDIENPMDFYPLCIKELEAISEQITSRSLVLIALISSEICSFLVEHVRNINLERDRKRFLDNNFSVEYQKVKEELNYENAMSGVEFENILSKVYSRLGYDVEITKATGDQGADLILERGNERIAVQAKYYSGKVGNSAVQEVVAAMKYYNTNDGWVVTNSDFTNSAVQLADVNNITLINREKLSVLRDNAINQ